MSVPLYIHVPVVLALLSSHAWTFLQCKRKIETLQMALTARRVLFGEHQVVTGNNVYNMVGGDTLSLKDVQASQIEITASAAVTLNVMYRR